MLNLSPHTLPHGRPGCSCLLNHPFLLSHFVSYGIPPRASPLAACPSGESAAMVSDKLVPLAASRLREWVAQTFVQPAAEQGGLMPAVQDTWQTSLAPPAASASAAPPAALGVGADGPVLPDVDEDLEMARLGESFETKSRISARMSDE